MVTSATTKITIPSSHIIKRRSGADRTPASYYVGPGFKSETFFFVFLSSSIQMLRKYFALGYNRFLLRYFQFLIQ